MNKFGSVRFWLFTNSYSGKAISDYLREECQGNNINDSMKRLSQTLDFNHKQLEKHVLQKTKSKCPYARIPLKIKIYLEIEKELVALAEEKLDKYSTAKEDYQNQLFSPATERAAGNSLTDIKNDQRFNEKLEENIRTYRITYYKVAYKYKLPTIRIVPFILRLVT